GPGPGRGSLAVGRVPGLGIAAGCPVPGRGEAAFEPRSRRPGNSPRAISQDTVELIIRLRKELAGQGRAGQVLTRTDQAQPPADVRLRWPGRLFGAYLGCLAARMAGVAGTGADPAGPGLADAGSASAGWAGAGLRGHGVVQRLATRPTIELASGVRWER